MKRSFLLLSILAVAGICSAQTTQGLDPLIQNVYGRDVQSLNGYWNYTVDPLETGYYDYRRRPDPNGFFKDIAVDNVKTYKEYDFDASPVMRIPGDWNTFDDNLFLYDGTIWFRRKFDHEPSGGRAFLWFGAVNYDAKVYLNGRKVGEHVGGYTPFNFDVTDLLKEGENNLVVKVDNKRSVDGVPTNNFDWFNYGGINRDVLLVKVPDSFIRTYSVRLRKGTTDTVEMAVHLGGNAAGQEVRVDVPELGINLSGKTDSEGLVRFEARARKLALWSPENPKLYDVSFSTASDMVGDRIGFRTIETRGREILLNGKPVFLKGISIHEEAAFRNGRIFSAEEGRILLEWARELGCNYVRLAHYPHNEQMVRQAEEMGLMVWSEIPVYWTIQWQKEEVYANALNQLDEMIERDQNRACVIIWSIANETPHGDARDRFLSSLSNYAREKDGTRLISMAMERNDKSREILSVRDNMSEYVDIISVNQYVGWYDGINEKLDRVSWEIDYDKPFVISEMGGGALFGKRGDDSHIWTEDYQADLYRRTIRLIEERMTPLAGMSPWVLKDFRSSRRLLPHIQDGFNRKGLISDQGQRKQAFYILREWYSTK